MLALACLLAMGQSTAAPILPAGVNADLHRAFVLVEEALEKGQFDEAKAKLALLPRTDIVFSWDDSKVPANLRPEFRSTREAAFKLWNERIPEIKLVEGAKPQIKFSFEKELAKLPDSDAPRGIALFFSENPAEPRLESVIGLTRGNPAENISNISLFNEIVFTVGNYLGLAASPFPNSASGRHDFQMPVRSMIQVHEINLVGSVKSAEDQLRKAVEKKQRLTPARPKVTYDPDKIERGPVLQGTPVDLSVQLNNVGNAPVSFRAIPDCSCIAATPGGLTPPGGSSLVKLIINTADIANDFEKHLIVVTNDPDRPYFRVPLHIRTIPRYRFISPKGSVLIVDEGGLDVDLFLVTPAEYPFQVNSVEVVGNPGAATIEPWKGELADPEYNEPVKPRQGHRIKLHLDEPQVSGRSAATLVLKTDDEKYPELRYPIFAQKGIAVLPASAYLGELGQSERKASMVLSRPTRPFKIEKAECDSAYISVTAEPIKDETEYILKIVYNEKAPIGDLRAMITVTTNEPKQKTVRIPVMGTVR